MAANAGAATSSRTAPDQRLRAAIIRRYALNEESVAHIASLQDAQGLRFSDAAIRLGYATQAEIDSLVELSLPPMVQERQLAPAPVLGLAHDPYHPRSEQIRSLRTELLLRHEAGNEANILAVLSPCAGEGRSQLAAELAIAFSQLGRPTLLVDADLRHPRLHSLFGASNARGLSHALVREQRSPLHGVAGLPDLFLLTSGPLPRNPLELLSDRRFEALVADWRQTFEFVVLDTPPVQRYADGLAVATIVGRVLSLSRAKHTPYRDTRNMLRRLAATRSRILGAVINYF
ncbi:CpsD/CapB family tyrosine-protein kinase [Sinimarinibacterium flocculans]|uniref:CpsD/CapB family tyrosine-protein kinase n=1 Tax=Sinimarinibacterium flocculans TaxID=985250 RepID=UPI002491D83B|nr:CpsD/CapB family tyrosine-protein kinase [Sinimarinibacterium flocculans]